MIMPFLAVKDIDASVKFYTEQLGFEHRSSIPGPDGATMFGFVNKDGNDIGFACDPDLQARGNGVVFMIYMADDTDIDAYYEDVKKRGTQIESEIKTEYWGDRLFSVKDPDGYQLSLCKNVKVMTFEDIQAVTTAQSS